MTTHSDDLTKFNPNPLPHNTLPSRQAWLSFIDKSFLTIGAIAMILALVFFIAYNWVYMGRMGKFALVEALLTVSVFGYAILAYLRKFERGQGLLLMIASIATGCLLALVGQVYQTGADTWQLFFSWALLIIPFVLIARLPALWLLWLGLVNLTIRFYMYPANVNMWFATHLDFHTFGLIAQGLINFSALYLWLLFVKDESSDNFNSQLNRRTTRTHNTYHWSTYVVGILATYSATLLGIYNTSYGTGFAANIITFGLWALMMAFLYWRFYKKQIDLLMLTCFCSSIIFVVIALSIHYLLHGYDSAAFLLLAIMLIGMSSIAVSWLLRLHKQQNNSNDSSDKVTNNNDIALHVPIQSAAKLDVSTKIDVQNENSHKDSNPNDSNKVDDNTPWYLQLFLGFCGLLSGLLLLVFIMLIFGLGTDNISALSLIGCLLIGSGFALFKNNPNHLPFINSFAFSLSLAGQALVAFALFYFGEGTASPTFILLAIQVVLLILMPNFIHRIASGFIALGCMVWLLCYFNAPELAAGYIALIACVFNLQRDAFLNHFQPQSKQHSLQRQTRHSDTTPSSVHPLNVNDSPAFQIFKAIALASILMLLTVTVFFITAEYKNHVTGIYNEFYYLYPLAQGVLIATSLYAGQIILRRYGYPLFSRTGALVALAIVLLGIVSLYVSGLLATSLVIVIGFANQKRPIFILGIIALVCYIFWYYYQLDTSLLMKSLSMLATAILVLLIRWGLIHSPFRSTFGTQKTDTCHKELSL